MIKSTHLGTAKNQWRTCLNIFYLNCAFYSMMFSKWIWILYFPVFIVTLRGMIHCSWQKCCYSSYGSLLFATLGAGYVFLNSPLVLPAAVTQESDILPYTWCCVKAHMCEQFFIQRPSDNCYTYSPVSTGRHAHCLRGIYKNWQC